MYIMYFCVMEVLASELCLWSSNQSGSDLGSYGAKGMSYDSLWDMDP